MAFLAPAAPFISAATSVMVVEDQLSSHLGKNIISLICGGNIDSELFRKIVK